LFTTLSIINEHQTNDAETLASLDGDYIQNSKYLPSIKENLSITQIALVIKYHVPH